MSKVAVIFLFFVPKTIMYDYFLESQLHES